MHLAWAPAGEGVGPASGKGPAGDQGWWVQLGSGGALAAQCSLKTNAIGWTLSQGQQQSWRRGKVGTHMTGNLGQ